MTNKKTFYTYNTETGIYIGPEEAIESQREVGQDKWLNSPNSTDIEPPAAAAHKAVCWDAGQGKWVKRDDYRGGVYYDKTTQEKHEIKELGVKPTADETDIEPTDAAAEWDEETGEWAVPFAVKKSRKKAEIQAWSNSRIAAIRAGYTQGEVETFEQQYSGATDIIAENEGTTTARFVLALLAGRLGHEPSAEEKTSFANLIISNYTAAATASATILGTQQRLELQARAATTDEELDAIALPVETE